MAESLRDKIARFNAGGGNANAPQQQPVRQDRSPQQQPADRLKKPRGTVQGSL